MTTNLPVPESIIKLSSCRCKTGCDSGRCRCHKNSLLCSEMCLCEDCGNMEDEYDDSEIDTDDELDEI